MMRASTPGKKYAITFALAERTGDTSMNPVEVSMGGVSLGIYTATGTSHVSYSALPTAAGSGNHTLTFRAAGGTSGQPIAFVDKIAINQQLDQPELTVAAQNPTPFINSVSIDVTSNGKIKLPASCSACSRVVPIWSFKS
ncbi:MAG: hypothetical protein NT172_09950 [Planctomycetota bacterium]|nr:hypothetical protein [Planctomycetota bacterium]